MLRAFTKNLVKVNQFRLYSETHLGDRTSITRQLWEMRRRDKERLNPERSATLTDHKIITKKPSESYCEIMLPFSTDAQLRDQYLSPFGNIRIGRLLEDLDAFAGNIAFVHADDCDPETIPLTIVTASMDSLDLHQQLASNRDMRLRGMVTWVGTSSMEIKIDADGKQDSGKWDHIFTSYFTMVARSVEAQKSIQVNRLEPATPEEIENFKQGEENKTRRLKNRKQSVFTTPPTFEESSHLYQLYKNKLANPQNFIPMNSTFRETTILCQFQQRNLHNKLFGGYLMRHGFELAFSTAFLFAKKRPLFQGLADISFVEPVSIGSILSMKSNISYVDREKGNLQVSIDAEVFRPDTSEKVLTNKFSFTFHVPDTMLPIVFPAEYNQTLIYFDGKRKYDGHLENKKNYKIPHM